MISRISHYILMLTLYPCARLIVTLQSERQRWKTMGQKPIVHFETAFNGQRIMLLALYEKGELRPDVIRLLEAAHAEGLYVVAVNTLKLTTPANYEGLIDCYIERPNFGRDFGSYQTGFLHIFNNKWHETCPRLLMINDSIFFSSKRMPKFLADLMNSEMEVLGSTENYDIDYHLGSFCISITQSILQNAKFQQYWQKYRLSDVRPKVIKEGELRLSKELKSCVSIMDSFGALYSALRFSDTIKTDAELRDFAIKNTRTSKIFAWKRASLKDVMADYHDRFALEGDDGLPSNVGGGDNYSGGNHISTYDELKSLLQRQLKTENISDEQLTRMVNAEVLESFMSGSQIHQNACILIKLGLPIIKLDGLYRGIFSYEDISRICELLEDDEADELEKILISRPFGGRYLTGWKRVAFSAGLL